MLMNRRLYRSRTDSVIGGVAGGVAEYLDVDPSIVRIVWAVLAIVTGGIFFVLYIVMWIVVPEGAQVPGAPRYQPGPGAMPGWTPPVSGPTAPVAPAAPADPSAPPDVATAAAMPPADTVEGAGVAPAVEPFAAPAEPVAGWNAYGAPEAHHRRRGSGGAMIFGLVLIVLGAWFLIDQYVPGIDSDLLWPIALVLIGGALLFISMRRRSEEG
jgi:phage shock protein PspC (stress-responsive transcriptional regulator)